MNYNISAYGVYLLLTVYVIVIVGNVLHNNGRPFLLTVFHGKISLADSVNSLLITGYYLLNIGYCVTTLKIWKEITTLQEFVEAVSSKTGKILLLLGLIHLFNVFVLLIMEKKYRNKKSDIINNLKHQSL